MQKARYLNHRMIGLWFFLLFSLPACRPENGSPMLDIGGNRVTIEIVDTPATHQQGLSDRLFMEPNHGMLFVFSQPSAQSFWMYHCHFDIDLAYIDSSGTIQEIMTMKKEPYDTPPGQLKTYPSQSANIQYVLEMGGGWFKKHNIKPGIKLDVIKYKTEY